MNEKNISGIRKLFNKCHDISSKNWEKNIVISYQCSFQACGKVEPTTHNNQTFFFTQLLGKFLHFSIQI